MPRFSLIFLLVFSCSRHAEPPPRSAAAPTAAAPTAAAPTAAAPSSELRAPGEAKLGDRTLCMVSNEEFVVTESSPRVEHNGKTYYFCCKGCDTDFKKDPEKYLRKKP